MRTTKLRAILLALLTIVALAKPAKAEQLPTDTWESTTEEVIQEGDVYKVSTGAQLAWIALTSKTDDFASKTVQLTANIDLAGKLWIPISTFKGTFDGDGFVIRNMKVDNSQAGLISFLGDNGKVMKLGIIDCDITFNPTTPTTDKTYAGGIAARSTEGSQVHDCFVTGKIKNLDYSGGIIGLSTSSNIANCYAHVDITGNDIAGHSGGIVGYAQHGTTSCCYATGKIINENLSTKVEYLAGGIAGYNVSKHTITDCIALNTGGITITRTNAAGRIVGYNDANLAYNYASPLVEFKPTRTLENSLNGRDGEDLKSTDIASLGSGALGRWFNTSWEIKGNKLPTLIVFKKTGSVDNNPEAPDRSSFFSNTIVTITTSDQLKAIANSSDEFILGNDITLPKGWEPINFSGKLDGKGFIIKELEVKGAPHAGLFAKLENAVIKNLGIEKCDVNGQQSAGGITGQSKNSMIENCFVSGKVSGGTQVGGIVGDNSGTSLINRCYSTAAITNSGTDAKSSTGGIVGRLGSTSVTNCIALNLGGINGGKAIGRVAGQSDGSLDASNHAFPGILVNGSPAGKETKDATELTEENFQQNGDAFNGWKDNGWVFNTPDDIYLPKLTSVPAPTFALDDLQYKHFLPSEMESNQEYTISFSGNDWFYESGTDSKPFLGYLTGEAKSITVNVEGNVSPTLVLKGGTNLVSKDNTSPAFTLAKGELTLCIEGTNTPTIIEAPANGKAIHIEGDAKLNIDTQNPLLVYGEIEAESASSLTGLLSFSWNENAPTGSLSITHNGETNAYLTVDLKNNEYMTFSTNPAKDITLTLGGKKQEGKLSGGSYTSTFSHSGGKSYKTYTSMREYVYTEPEQPDPVYYNVTLPQLTGASTNPGAAVYSVEEWDQFNFYLLIEPGYDQSVPVVTTSQGETLKPRVSDGCYTINYVLSDVEVYINGILPNPAVSNDSAENQVARVTRHEGTLHIYTPNAVTGSIYTYDGMLIKKFHLPAGESQTEAPSGACIVRIGEKAFKLAN